MMKYLSILVLLCVAATPVRVDVVFDDGTVQSFYPKDPSTRPASQPTTQWVEVNWDDVALAATGDTKLNANTRYVLTKTKHVVGPLVKSGTGSNPVIVYKGPKDTTALYVDGGKTAVTNNINFEIGQGAFAVGGQGDFVGDTSLVMGGGGFLKVNGGGNITLKNWVLPATETLTNYGISAFVAQLVTKNQAGQEIDYRERWTKSLTLLNCYMLGHITGPDHIVRVMGCDNVTIIGGMYVEPDRRQAVLRIHQSGTVKIGDPSGTVKTTFVGDVGLSPMDGGDGGINLPPGPRRDYLNAYRMKSLSVTHVDFDAPRGIRLSAGVSAGVFDSCTESFSLSTAIVGQFPYMDRPASKVDFVRMAWKYTGTSATPPKVFPGVGFSANMTTTACTYNGKPFSK